MNHKSNQKNNLSEIGVQLSTNNLCLSEIGVQVLIVKLLIVNLELSEIGVHIFLSES